MHLHSRGTNLILCALFWLPVCVCHCGSALAADHRGPATTAPLALDDLSILFPVPSREQDLDRTIAVQDLSTTASGTNASVPVFPADLFDQIVSIANSPAGAVAGTQHRISLPAELRKLDAWFIAGIRIDAGAPGLSPDIIDQYGQAPQIRLILQPVTKAGNGVLQIHDTAIHLIFGFTTVEPLPPAQANCFQRLRPDTALFGRIISDVVTLRDDLAQGHFGGAIKTSGMPLGAHPGLKDETSAKRFRDALKAFLERYLVSERLQAAAIMAIPDGQPEPWMFLSFLRIPPNVVPQLPKGGFIPVRGPMLDGAQFTQALSFQDAKNVLPTPQNNNLDAITCRSEATTPPTLPASERHGLATAELFANPPPSVDRVQKITSLVADPTRSHFFNTDCISCHTETRRDMDLLHATTFDHVDNSVLPQEKWNIRNFGWFPSFFRAGRVEATVTRRTANETQAVVDFVNKTILSK